MIAKISGFLNTLLFIGMFAYFALLVSGASGLLWTLLAIAIALGAYIAIVRGTRSIARSQRL